ncbi:hypothetical protein Tco_0525819 [Tanacetum coccineum]
MGHWSVVVYHGKDLGFVGVHGLVVIFHGYATHALADRMLCSATTNILLLSMVAIIQSESFILMNDEEKDALEVVPPSNSGNAPSLGFIKALVVGTGFTVGGAAVL